eukprot:scaffold381_cov178-Amphora_coffeaeformis.AAC.5
MKESYRPFLGSNTKPPAYLALDVSAAAPRAFFSGGNNVGQLLGERQGLQFKGQLLYQLGIQERRMAHVRDPLGRGKVKG